jgi:hypothetical protein
MGKQVTATFGLNGADSANYTLTQTKGLKADITPAELTIENAALTSKVYDGTTNAINTKVSLGGLISGDTVTIGTQTASFDTKNVGIDKPVSVTITISGADASNYLLKQPTDMRGSITSAALTIGGSFSVFDRDFDGTLDATIKENNLVLVGLFNSDSVELVDLITAFSQSETGDSILVNIIGASLIGSDTINYTLSLENSPSTTASIKYVVKVNEVEAAHLAVYPNPFTDNIKFSGSEVVTKFTLINVEGQKLLEKTLNGEQSINTMNCIKGYIFYFLNF